MTPTRPPTELASALVERCAGEMVARWRDGDRPPAEEFLNRFPDLWQQPDAALELIAEELALRDEYGLPASPSELAGRFPRWPAQVAALLDCHAVLGPRLAPPVWPEPGDRLGDFDLRAELGRGAHARVYLATQPALAGRPVVLKVGPDSGGEHLSLARLQHTHVVPLYSIHEFPDRRLRALCLPYFGGATLADVQARLARSGHRPAGADLLLALGPSPLREADSSPRGPARGFLERATLAEAVCWVGACLADALQYAHDRGLLHLDLKPSNVLIAADGVPMLLDFHLARPPLAAGDPPPVWLGGTPGYMPPEQEAAVQAVRDGRPVPTAVDGRADVFALGVLLTTFLRENGGELTPGLADVLARCTAPAAADRYPTAGQVATDLRRHLSDLPLRGVGNRSLVERWGKWRRRRPYALPLALTLTALMAVAGGLVGHAGRLADRAGAALRDGEVHTANGRYAEAVEALRGGEALAEGLPFHPALRTQLRDARQAAERAQAADDLHTFCEQVRWLAAADDLPPHLARPAERRCREIWDKREAFAAGLAGQPTPGRDERRRADLLDLAILAADLAVRIAPPGERPAARTRALATLDEAERLLGPSGVLDLERARHARSLGLTQMAGEAARRAEGRPRRGAWDAVIVGRSYLAAGDARRALTEFDHALALDPQALWANYYRGAACLRLGRPTEAVAAFSACVALAPPVAWCAHNRGLAYTEAGQLEAARADFDRAIVLDPSLAAAYLGRAAVHHKAGRSAEALADLAQAERAGAPPAEVSYRRAVVHLAANDRAAAVDCLRDCLKQNPDHADARQLLTRLTAGR